MSDAVIEAYLTNLGKYVEGELCGEYLKLPAEKEDVQRLLARIGVDGVLYEEIFITDYETDIPGLYDCLGEYESIDELNYLANLLSDMDEGELQKFSAAVELGEYTRNAGGLINLAQNLDCYEFYPGVTDAQDLGYYLIDELCMLDIPDHIKPYFDYEAYGRDIYLGENGIFSEHGFIALGGGFRELYSGREDLPDEYRIFAYPEAEKMNMRDRLAMYGRMIPDAAPAHRPAPAHEI